MKVELRNELWRTHRGQLHPAVRGRGTAMAYILARVSSKVRTPVDAPSAVQQSAAARLANLPAGSSGIPLISAVISAPNQVSPAPVVSTTLILAAGMRALFWPSSR